MLRLGSLCSGYGGLDLAAEYILGPLNHTWYAEHDPDAKVQHAAAVCAAHWPDVPNLGDLTAIDWTTVPRVDVLTAGFPCTDVSAAGKRAGLKPGTRTGIWSHIAHGIGVLRPRLVLLENVEGLLSGRAHSDVEPCPWCLGDVDPELVVRALGAVLADLADLGFDAEWTTVAASDVGAPHRRRRVFIAAWPAADTESVGHGHSGPPRFGGVPAAAVAGATRAGAGGVTLLPTPRAQNGEERNQNIWRRPAGQPQNLENALALLPTPRATDGTKGGPNQRGSSGDLMLPSAVVQLLPTPTSQAAKHSADDRGPGTFDDSNLWSVVTRADQWGAYAPAIARWEAATGRPAPDPTEPGTKGQQRLAPAFVEWLMGLAAGWVTDHLPRNPSLKCLGNGVVWQQAAHAYAELLGTA